MKHCLKLGMVKRMDLERLYVTQALCESNVFEKLRMIIAEKVSGIYDVKITNTLNNKYYFLKFVVKATTENYTKLCEVLQNNGVILINCYELIFPSYKITIKGDAEKCLTIQNEILKTLLSYGSVPLKTEMNSDDFIVATCDIIVTNKDPSKSMSFLEIMRKNSDLKFKIIPITGYD